VAHGWDVYRRLLDEALLPVQIVGTANITANKLGTCNSSTLLEAKGRQTLRYYFVALLRYINSRFDNVQQHKLEST
jgi:hypothetical protein